MDKRFQSYDYEMIAKDLIDTEDGLRYIKDSNVKICYLSSDAKKASKGHKLLGQCEKVQDKYKWAIPYDFTITVFKPNVEGLSEMQIRMLLYHELLHVGIDRKENGSETYFNKPHDLEDFKCIIDMYGTDWARPERELLPFEEDDSDEEV